jgi:hypothetical protein
MTTKTKRRPPRQPLSEEEVVGFIRFKKFQKQKAIEHFKKTKRYTFLNVFNLLSLVVYTELIISFFGFCAFHSESIQSVNPYFTSNSKGPERECSSMVIHTGTEEPFDIQVNDVIDIPKAGTYFFVGKDMIMQKDVVASFRARGKSYIIRQAFPLLFISCLLSISTLICYGFDMNHHSFSLTSTAVINAISLLSFILL